MIKLDLNPPETLAYLSLGHGRGEATYRDINERNALRLAGAQGLCGLRIDAPTMPRPRQLLEILQHLPSLSEATGRIRRVAALSDSPPNEFLEVLRHYFPECEVRHFSAAAQRAADHWLSSAEIAGAASVAAPATPGSDFSLEQEDAVIVLDESDAVADDDIDDWFVKS